MPEHVKEASHRLAPTGTGRGCGGVIAVVMDVADARSAACRFPVSHSVGVLAARRWDAVMTATFAFARAFCRNCGFSDVICCHLGTTLDVSAG
uniref:Uncharacterized protein n=1 Tax=Ixodes ricinus TaxID=34613 RepID=A0A6B0UHC5_IXORI